MDKNSYLRFLLILAVLFVLPVNFWGQQQQQPPPPADSGPFSAEEEIALLQQNPDLLAEAKKEIVDAARARGYAISQAQITDERLFEQIRSDDRVRLLMSDELKKRGYEPAAPEPAETPAATPQKPATATPVPANATAPPAPGAEAAKGKEGAPEKEKKRMGAGAKGNQPYRNLEALRDLYTRTATAPEKLERFGAALFRNSAGIDKTAIDTSAGPDYVLGPGDEIVVSYYGTSSQRLQLAIDREGRIVLPEVGGIVLAGRTLGDAHQVIQAALMRQFRGISVDVSLGKLKNVRVYVVGDVQNPGAYDISALSTAMSAVLAAGGPTDTGSLRTVKHFRGKKLVEDVDLYDLMLKGVTSGDQRIQSGDSILVPPVGPQITVTGKVRRPAIYELHGEQTLDQALDLAGGILVSGELGSIKVERIEAHERKLMLNASVPKGSDARAVLESYKKFPIQDGDLITVSSILPYSEKTIYLEGHVFRPGKYPFTDGMKVTDILGSYQDILPEPADRAEIIHLRAPDFRPYATSFNIRDVLDKRQESPELQPFDTVRVYGRYETDAPRVYIYGEVLRPGEYPLSEKMTAADLLRIAGGFKRSAYLAAADLASYAIVNGDHVQLEHRDVALARAVAGEPGADVPLKAGDVLTIRQMGGWNDIGGAITLSGQVVHPGRYGIQEGERLSSVLRRAGGFSPEAYPYGAVLERDQVREISSKNRDDLVRKLQAQGLETDPSGKSESPAVARQRQQLIEKLKQLQPNGRLIIHISTQISKWENTPADVEVRSGDTLLIPRRPNFVLVAGQVYSPSAITFSPGKHGDWYLRQAGGATGLGSKKEVFVVRANGMVVGKSASRLWTGSPLATLLEPGDTVYVPEKITGSDKLKLYAEIAQVASGALVAAKVAGIF